MKLIYIILITLAITYTQLHSKSIEQYHNEFKQLSVVQIETITDAFVYGKRHNLQWSLAAIAWQESNAGINQISTVGTDYGICQINIKSYLERHNIPNNRWTRSKYATLLITEPYRNYQAAVDELRYWETKKQSWESYRKVWSSYNGGHRGNSHYAEQIAKRIQVLKLYFKGI